MLFSLGIITTLIFIPITLVQIYNHTNNDYGGHIYYSEKLQEGFNQIIPTNQSHPLYQILLLAIHVITRLDFRLSAVLLALLVEVLLGFELIRLFNKSMNPEKSSQSNWAIPLAVGVMIAAPIPLLVFVDQHLYFGYLGITNYHNPTINLLKPLAILNFIYGVKVFQSSRHKIYEVVFAAILIALSTLDKPNLTICILPALAILAGVNYLNKKPVDWTLLSLGFFIPAGLLLGWEYFLAFNPGGGGIQLEPFAAMRMLSDHVISKFLISILFPAGLTIIYFRDIIKDKRMILAWLIFFFGAFYTYFLIEGGARRADGNFGWSGEISMFILFIFSTIFFLEKKIETPKFSIFDILLAGICLLNVSSGVIYYFYCLNVNHISYLPKGIIPILHLRLFEYKPGLF
jgi:hypothetical protein